MGKYSDRYLAIRKDAETNWPDWKVDAYNNTIAVSAHARKVIKKGGLKCTIY